MATNLALVANFVDITRPTLSIVSPTLNQQWSNATFTATGKANDNVAVDSVYYSLNGAPWTNATTLNNWTNWSASLPLVPGTNSLQAFAVDTSGNASTTNSVSFEYVASLVSPAVSVSTSVLPIVAAPAILSPAGFVNGQYSLTVLGTTNAQYVVQASTDLVNWVSVQTNTPPFTYVDTMPANSTNVSIAPFTFSNAMSLNQLMDWHRKVNPVSPISSRGIRIRHL